MRFDGSDQLVQDVGVSGEVLIEKKMSTHLPAPPCFSVFTIKYGAVSNRIVSILHLFSVVPIHVWDAQLRIPMVCALLVCVFVYFGRRRWHRDATPGQTRSKDRLHRRKAYKYCHRDNPELTRSSAVQRLTQCPILNSSANG